MNEHTCCCASPHTSSVHQVVAPGVYPQPPLVTRPETLRATYTPWFSREAIPPRPARTPPWPPEKTSTTVPTTTAKAFIHVAIFTTP